MKRNLKQSAGNGLASSDFDLLTAFYSAHGGFVVEADLGVPKTKIAGRLEHLGQLGYVLDTHPQQGIRLLESPDGLMADDLMARMKSEEAGVIGNQILVFEKTTSTNDVAQRLAAEDFPEGLVVFAESQSKGRGRHGRSWVSPERKGLWFSVLLRPSFSMEWASRLTVMAAVAVCRALRKSTGLPLKIKWPNDILCHDRKVAGILVELKGDIQKIQHAVIGIGINVNSEKGDFPKELTAIATSLKIESKRLVHRPTLAVEILKEMNACQDLLSDEKFPRLLESWGELDYTLGRQVSIQWMNGKTLRGFASHLDLDGALMVRVDDGRVERVLAGDVTLEKF